MARYHFEREIDAPPRHCYDCFSNLGFVQEHSSEVVEMKPTNDTPFGPGMEFTCSRRMMGKVHSETLAVDAAEPGKSYTMRCDTCGMRWLSNYTFESLGAGTRTKVTLDMTCTPMTLMARLTSPMMVFFAGAAKKSINKEMDELKAACEASATTAPASA